VTIARAAEDRLVASPRVERAGALEIAAPGSPPALSVGAPPRVLVTSRPGSSPIAVEDAPSELHAPPDARRTAAPGLDAEPSEDARPIAHLQPPALVFPKGTPLAVGATGPSTPAPAATPEHKHKHSPSPAPVITPEAESFPRIEMPSGDFMFPLAALPKQSWHSGGCNFGASRDHGARRHAGCDLKEPKGTQIYAVADGILVQRPYAFTPGVHAVEIQHGPYLMRYGEILPGSYTGGKTVKKGEPICKIGILDSGKQMLHFEIYSNGSSRVPLTNKRSPSLFRRRSDLMDPTKLLDEWASRLIR
jgi:hypothetical protein